MKLFLRLFVFLPLAAVILTLALANRDPVFFSLDPFVSKGPDRTGIMAPLFALLFVAGIGGVFAGGLTVWFAQGRFRKEMRRAGASAREADAECVRLRTRLAALDDAPAEASLPGLKPPARVNVR